MIIIGRKPSVIFTKSLFLLTFDETYSNPKADIIDSAGKIISVLCKFGTSSKVKELPMRTSNIQPIKKNKFFLSMPNKCQIPKIRKGNSNKYKSPKRGTR